MDWQNDEFEVFLRKFRLREARPLTLEQPAGIRRYRVKIAAAAGLVFAIGVSAAIVRQLASKSDAPGVVEQPKVGLGPVAAEAPTTGPAAAASAPIPPLPQSKTPSVKLDPKAPEPLKQLTVVVPAPPQDAGPASKQDPSPQVGPDPDKGHQAFLASCGSCHAVEAVENSHFDTPKEYQAIVDRMVSYGAPVTPQEASAIVDYIFKTYGKKSPVADDRGKSVFNMACVACHGPDVVENRRNADRAAYRSIVDNMIAYGAGVAPDQIDALVDYLFKTYGKKQPN